MAAAFILELTRPEFTGNRAAASDDDRIIPQDTDTDITAAFSTTFSSLLAGGFLFRRLLCRRLLCRRSLFSTLFVFGILAAPFEVGDF